MDELFGRSDECTELRAVLDRARRGMAAAAVLRGGPGSGKTALLDYVHHTADPEFGVSGSLLIRRPWPWIHRFTRGRDHFDAVGADGYAARTAEELSAAGALARP